MKRRKGSRHRSDATAFLLSGESSDIHTNWAISYGDMVTLLLSFFVMFFGFKESTKFQKFRKEIEVHANQAKGGQGQDVKAGAGAGASAAAGPSAGALPEPAKSGLAGDDKKGSRVEAAWDKLSKLDNARFVKDQSRLVVEFPEISFFKFRDVGLTKEGSDELAKFSRIYRDYQNELKLIVIGYTDSVPVRRAGSRYKDNLELSALRGVSAVRFLVEQGISQERMRFGGEGEWHGRSSYDDAGGAPVKTFNEAMARKVVLVVEAEDAPKR